MSAIEFRRPFPVQFAGNPVARMFLKCIGWRFDFEGLPARQGMLVIYPHTSNWDFVILVLVKWSTGIPVSFWGKDKLFGLPLFGRWLRWLGGVPVDRTSSRGVVGHAVDQFAIATQQDRYFWLVLAPEGTRKKIAGWRSGFYQTALRAKLPLGLVRLDYGRREVTVREFMYLSGDEADDFRHIAKVYDGVIGCIPENATPIRLLPPFVPRSETIVK
jgi:1-acyl-sn-glycerol-3-phosphate acyltransferase